jgi:hypothetical protein
MPGKPHMSVSLLGVKDFISLISEFMVYELTHALLSCLLEDFG